MNHLCTVIPAQLLIGFILASQHCLTLGPDIVWELLQNLNSLISEKELEFDSHLESWSQRLFAPCLDWVTPSSMENYRGNIVQSVLLSAPAWRMEIWPGMKKHITPRSGEVGARMKAQGCERVVFLPFCSRQLISIQTTSCVSCLPVNKTQKADKS